MPPFGRVQGASISEIADTYFSKTDEPRSETITRACRAVHGKLALTASWGVSALQALTAGEALEEMSEEERKTQW